MGIGKTIRKILFCFVLLFGAGLKGYGQDRKIVIDSVFEKIVTSDYTYCEPIRCVCLEEERLKWEKRNMEYEVEHGQKSIDIFVIGNNIKNITFYFYDKRNYSLFADTTVKQCSFIVTEEMFNDYSRNNAVFFYVCDNRNRWGFGKLDSKDLEIHLNLYPQNDDFFKQIKKLK